MTLRAAAARLRDRSPRGSLAVAGTLLVLVGGGVVSVRTLDVGVVASAAAAADPALFGAALAVYLFSWPIRGRRYGDVLAPMGHRCRTGFLTAAVFASQTANLAVPARAGDGVRAYLLNDRRGVPYSAGAASLAVERAFDLVALGTLGGLAVAALALDGEAPGPGAATGVGAVASGRAVAGAAVLAVAAILLSTVSIAVARSDRRFGAALRERAADSRLFRPVDAAVRFGAAVRVVAADPGALARVFLASGVVWALDVATAVLVLTALVDLGPAELLVAGTLAVSAGNLAKVLPLSQGGIGLYEAAFTGIVVAVTPVPAEPALAAAVLDHALKNAVTLAGGGVVAAVADLSPTAGPTDAEPGRTDTGPPSF